MSDDVTLYHQTFGYLNKEDDAKYISSSLRSVIKGNLQLIEDRIAKLLFKLAVEMSMMMIIICVSQDIDEDTLRKFHGKCIKDVKSSIGKVSLENAVKFQNTPSSFTRYVQSVVVYVVADKKRGITSRKKAYSKNCSIKILTFSNLHNNNMTIKGIDMIHKDGHI